MIKFENTEVMGWEAAIRRMRAKGYRRTKSGKYEAFSSNRSKTVPLGTYETKEGALNAVFNYRVNRFVSRLKEYGLSPDDGVVYENNYIAFRNGMIFNLHGERMIGGVDRSGYRHGIIGRRNRDYHKVIADCFIPNPEGLRDVNHKNGNKLDNRVDNLERVTHSENVIHAFKTGLAKRRMGEENPAHKLTKKDVEYIRSVY